MTGVSTYFYHFDGLGSTIAMTNAAGTIVNKYAYDEYGNVLNQVEAVSNPFKYVGRYGVMHDDTGLLYMRARFYDPEVGRFLSKDPVGLWGGDVNLYRYALSNPVNWMDPWGLWYLDLNVGAPLFRAFGVTFGLQADLTTGDIYPYLGFGYVPLPGVAATVSPMEPCPGVAFGYQVGLPNMLGGQVGWGPKGGFFWELGIVTPGHSVTAFYVFEPYSPPVVRDMIKELTQRYIPKSHALPTSQER